MLSRRKFAACALCAVAGFAATAVGEANAQMPAGIKRTILSKTDMPDGKYVALLVAVEIDAGVAVPRHTHPGVESAYCLDGSAQLSIKDQPDRMVKAGDSFQVPTETVHSAKIGDKPFKLVVTYTVEKDKPLATVVPE
jgi:quercetin dioxygenase-like cupin family protein